MDVRDLIPDARDGLTRVDRAILWALHELQEEYGGRDVPTPVLWGVLVERGLDLTPEELSRRLAALGAREE